MKKISRSKHAALSYSREQIMEGFILIIVLLCEETKEIKRKEKYYKKDVKTKLLDKMMTVGAILPSQKLYFCT